MYFGLADELTEDVIKKYEAVAKISSDLKFFLRNKNYGKGIETLVIGVICVDPKFDFFCTERTKYTKSKKLLEYDVKLNHAVVLKASDKDVRDIVVRTIYDSLEIIEKHNIDDFDLEKFRTDLHSFFKEKYSIDVNHK